MLPRDSGALIRRRLDYRPPAFLVDRVDLEFDLNPSVTRVTSASPVRTSLTVRTTFPPFFSVVIE